MTIEAFPIFCWNKFSILLSRKNIQSITIENDYSDSERVGGTEVKLKYTFQLGLMVN